MKKILLALLLQTLVYSAFAGLPYNELWQKGNSFYAVHNYDSAAFYYEKIAAAQPANAEVYYNLGNAYYRLNNIGMAVLNYERAIRYKPDYTLAKDNLELTQSRIANRIQPTQDIFFVKWWYRLTVTTLAGVWAIIALALFLILLLSIVAGRLGWQQTFITRRVAFFAGLFCAVAVVMAYVSAEKMRLHNKAVVMIPDASLRGEKNNAKIIGLLPEGTLLTIEAKDGEWAKVLLPDGRSGWLRLDVIVIV